MKESILAQGRIIRAGGGHVPTPKKGPFGPWLLASISCVFLWPIIELKLDGSNEHATAQASLLTSPTIQKTKIDEIVKLYQASLGSVDNREELQDLDEQNPPLEIFPPQPIIEPQVAFEQPGLPVDMVSKVYQIIDKHAGKRVDGRELARAIVNEARLQNYDPLFVAAVIKSESMFNRFAKSHVGASGLMQIMPATGRWLEKNFEGLNGESRGSLTDQGHNLKLGITYLKHLEEMYNGDRVFTLIAYNWGPGSVEKATSGKRKVPSEVIRYAIQILNDHRRWQAETS